MESNAAVDAGPVTGVAVAPLGEDTPGGMPSVQYPVSHVAGGGLHAGGAEHLAYRNGIFAVLVPSVNGSHLVRHVHHDVEGHRGRFRRGLRRRVRQHDMGIVEDDVPGFFIHHAVGFKTVLGLHGLYGPGGVFLEVAADRPFVVTQFSQPLLHLLDQFAGRAVLQLLFESNGFLSHHDTVVVIIHQVVGKIRCRGVRVIRLLALAQDPAFQDHILQVSVRHTCHFQVVLLLEGFHGLAGCFQVVAADLSLIVSQL